MYVSGFKTDPIFPSLGKHVREMYTPLNPTFIYRKKGGLQ